jgi:tripartite-type tricarboxylate transporter receptor subunit TctC
LKAALLSVFVLCQPLAGAQASYPERPITFVVPYPPGGPADLIARTVANKMSELAKQSIVVENKSGASGNIAGDYVARADKDGYTLMFGSSPVLVINPSLYKNLNFDPLKDYQPISDFGSLPNAVLVNSSLPVDTLDELIAYAKTHDTSFASAGSGGTTHLSGLLFAQSTGLNSLIHVPYRGSAPALQALLANQVTMTFTDVYTAYPFLKSGQLKILGVTSAERSELLPEVKTLREQGLADIDVSVFFALVAPKGIPREATDKLASLSRQVLADEEIRTQLKSRGLSIPANPGPEDLHRRMVKETEVWRQLIKSTHAAID